MPNYMLVSSTIMPVVAMIDAFRPSDVTKINGPLKIFSGFIQK